MHQWGFLYWWLPWACNFGVALDDSTEGRPRFEITPVRLTWISGMLAGFLFMGFLPTTLVHRGIKLEKIYLGAMITAINLLLPVATRGRYLVDGRSLGFVFPVNISYSLVASSLSPTMSGRASSPQLVLRVLLACGVIDWIS